MNLFYTPEHARVGDVIPFYENGLFKPFYLKNWKLKAINLHLLN